MLVALSHGAPSERDGKHGWGVAAPHAVAAPVAYAGHAHVAAPAAAPVAYAGHAHIAAPVAHAGVAHVAAPNAHIAISGLPHKW